ncbi:MAG TPA: ribosome maturation factor RimP [Gammaproteobacteria bacterium]
MSRAVDRDKLIELLEPPLRALGFELADLEAHLGRKGLLRIYIDREPGGVTLADCELVSEQIGAFLDVEDPLPGSYVLEVSSPGLDRRLRTPAHFERFAGEPVKVELREPQEGRRRLTGTLAGIEGDTVLLEADGRTWRLRLRDISVARLVPRI